LVPLSHRNIHMHKTPLSSEPSDIVAISPLRSDPQWAEHPFWSTTVPTSIEFRTVTGKVNHDFVAASSLVGTFAKAEDSL
jgi:hypothetical protein